MVFLTAARTRVGGPCRCSTLRWCLKKETSLIVVSMRSTQPCLSYLDRGTGEAVFDAGPLDASGKLRTDLLGQLRADLTAEKAGDLLRLDAQHRLAGEMLVERPERRD